MSYLIRLNPTAGIPGQHLSRHCLITGQTGAGKAVTVLKLTEALAKADVPVFLSDVKGDMSCLAKSCDVRTLDMLSGAVQVSIDAMGADLMARALDLTQKQAATLEIAMTWAARQNVFIHTILDLRATLAAALARRSEIAYTLGRVSPSSIDVIQYALRRLESMGGGRMFGQNTLDIAELIIPGRVTILDARQLFQTPRLYGAFLLWLMREFRQRMPDQGYLELPRMVLVFNEAHTLFKEAPLALTREVEQTASVISSKGVGLVWVGQSSTDISPIIADQCGTHINHDRSLGDGNVEFVTLNYSGNPTEQRVMRVNMPTCGYKPAVDVPPPAEVKPMTRTDYLIVLGAMAFFIASIALFVWLVANGTIPLLYILISMFLIAWMRPGMR